MNRIRVCNLCQIALSLTTKQVYVNSNVVRSISGSTVCNERFNKADRRDKLHSNNTSTYNPGVERRLKILKQDTPDIDSKTVLFEEDFEDLEADFLKAREMKQHSESIAKKQQIKAELKMTERRHFKPVVEPNMLTWSEKEQIRMLHTTDPIEWNIEKLAASFPATETVIKKVLKSSWRPESSDRVRNHDEKVIRNWKDFSENKLVISCPILKEHLKKFSKRSVLPQIPDSLKYLEKENLKPQGTEFANIIQSYKLLNRPSENKIPDTKKAVRELVTEDAVQERMDTSSVVKSCSNDNNDESEVKSSKPVFISNNMNYTLEELRKTIRKKHARSDFERINELDGELIKGEESVSSNIKSIDSFKTVPTNVSSLETNKQQLQVRHNGSFDTNSGVVAKNITKRIHIPKSKVKVGYLYKVDDCFYSHDGFFLYKVPGMSSQEN